MGGFRKADEWGSSTTLLGKSGIRGASMSLIFSPPPPIPPRLRNSVPGSWLPKNIDHAVTTQLFPRLMSRQTDFFSGPY